jgi:DNA polymerase III subunit gamma/tau
MNLNLARKWRSRNFDQVVGQELPIRMLKNSLFLDHYFPVYLFSGQRGCGKTTLARIFAGAANCKVLLDFQRDPKNNVIPCQRCDSCLAMVNGKHPDFVEIDAASHTGVDNVRNIIDAATLLPVLGMKKIYLIDEAHMLSKAAFNAFLKILEEPPASVFFILATTDPHKIIETVISRCFHLFFKPVPHDLLIKHLASICQEETIAYDADGLKQIVLQTEGSVRDALNLLEQVRFSHKKVSKDAVLAVLGCLDDERLLQLFDAALNTNITNLLLTIQSVALASFSTQIVWESLITLLRSALWSKHGVVFDEASTNERIQKIVAKHSAELLSSYLQVFYDFEQLFLKTRNQHRVLEMVLLTLCKMGHENRPAIIKDQKHAIADDQLRSEESQQTEKPVLHGAWNNFLDRISALDDPLLLSIFRQGRFVAFDDQKKVLVLAFPNNVAFFNELLEDTAPAWQKELHEVFGIHAKLTAQFNDKPKSGSSLSVREVPSSRQEKSVQAQSTSKNVAQRSGSVPVPRKSLEVRVNVSEISTWEKAQLLLQTFPGTMTEVKGDDYA